LVSGFSFVVSVGPVVLSRVMSCFAKDDGKGNEMPEGKVSGFGRGMRE
jgi:hypothetical protein